MSASEIILKLSNIESYYGPIQAIRGISLEVPRGQIVTLLGARGPEVSAVAAVADELRREIVGDEVTFVRNRNINYTNVCTFKCKFCGFSKGPLSLNLRGTPLTERMLDETVSLVAQMGHEPICAALDGGADVIIAGRACDDSVIASYPIWRGSDPALAIRELAAEYKVPVLEYPVLARSVYYTTRERQMIREELYVAVAAVLAFVLSLKRGETPPHPSIDVPTELRFDTDGRLAPAISA